MTLVSQSMNVYQAIRASKRGIAERCNRYTKRIEFAKKTTYGIRLVKGFTDPTIVRALPIAQELSRDWTPCDPKEAA